MKITLLKKILLTTSLMLCVGLSYAQTAVTIDFSTQKFLEDQSELDRTKYFNIHIAASNNYSDDDMADLDNWNITLGRSFWGPFGKYKDYISKNSTYPTQDFVKEESAKEISYIKSQNYYKHITPQLIITDHPDAMVHMDKDPKEAGAFAADVFKYGYEDEVRPLYYEPVNEPFVHAHEPIYTENGKYTGDEVRQKTAQYFKEIGKAFDEQGIDTKVVGYVSAWPQMELWDFGHWESRMKMFMDTAGQYMDGFSIHLYDGINVTGQDTERSGSNSIATLDLVSTYSNIKWDTIKPFVISEFGGIANGYGDHYSAIKSIQTVRSMNHLIFQLFDIQDRLLISIPFITGKSPWYYEDNDYEPYKGDLWKPIKSSVVNGNITAYEFTAKRLFYDLWKDVKGKRVQSTSSHQDIFVQTFVNTNQAFICLNNIDSVDQNIDLNYLSSLGTINSINKKSLKIYTQKDPVFESINLNAVPDSILIEPHETIILTFDLKRPIVFDKKIVRKEYFSKTYLQKIKANTTLNFNFNDVLIDATEGEARLRMSIGRKHDVSKAPTVKVNGINVNILQNWKGYDQVDKDDFFGAIEIPVPHNIIKENNTVEVTFPDDGGTVSSLILAVNNYYSIGERFPFYVDGHNPPNRIELEDFDIGGQSIGYYSLDNINNYEQYRFSEGVDIAKNETSYDIELKAGEWTSYTINVDKPTIYTLNLYGKALENNTIVSITAENELLGSSIKLKETANFSNHEIKVELSNGEYPIFVQVEQGNAKIDYIEFSNEKEVKDEISFTENNALVQLNSENIFEIEYNATTARDIVVEAWGDVFLLGKNSVSVKQGIDTLSIPLTLYIDSINYENLDVIAKVVPSKSLNSLSLAEALLSEFDDPILSVDNDLLDKENVVVFPNPTANNQEITVRGESKIYKVEILDLQGKVVDTYNYRTPHSQVSFKLSNHYINGIYLVRIYGESHYTVNKILIK